MKRLKQNNNNNNHKDFLISIHKEFNNNKIKHKINGVIIIQVHIKVVYNFKKINQ